MMDATDVNARLEQACQCAGARLIGGSAAAGEWTVRLASGAGDAVTVRCAPGQELVLCSLTARLPQEAGPAAGGPSLAEMATQAVGSVDALLRVEVAGSRGELTATWPIHADGLTVQELLRALAALGRVHGAVAAAAATVAGLRAQQAQLTTLVQGLRESEPQLAALQAQLQGLERDTGGAQPAAPATAPATSAPAAVQAARVVAPRCSNPQCGRPIPQGAGFCPVCGTPAPKEQAPPLQPSGFCQQCGKPLVAGARFCPGCGAPAS